MLLRLSLILLAACQADLSVASRALITCASKTDCPSDMECQSSNGRCVSKGAIDSKAPTLLSATAADKVLVTLAFSEAMAPSTPAAFSIAPTLAISAASLSADQQTITLVTDAQAPGQAYTVTVVSATDLAGNAIDLSANQAAFSGFGTAPDPAAPALQSPISGEVVTLTKPFSFSWTAPFAANIFEVQVATDAAFSNIVIDTQTSNASLLVPSNGAPALAAAVTYYWRVRADTTSALFGTNYPMATFDGIDDIVRVYCPASNTTCSDAGQVGNLSRPLQTLNGGLGVAGTRGISTIRVAGRGDSATYDETLYLIDGISMYGGYDPTFTTTSPSTPALIAVVGPAAVTATELAGTRTVFDGFSIVPGPNYPAAIYGIYITHTRGLKISHCSITPGNAITENAGVVILDSGNSPVQGDGPEISDSIITSSFAGDYGVARSAALNIHNSAARILRNTIISGDITSSAVGVSFFTEAVNAYNSYSIIDSNIITSGNAFTGASGGVYGVSDAVALSGGNDLVSNNVIRTGSADNDTFAIFTALNGLTTGMTTIVNNTIFVSTTNPAAAPDIASPFQASPANSRGIIYGQDVILANNLFIANPAPAAPIAGCSALDGPASFTLSAQNNSFFGFAAHLFDYCDNYACNTGNQRSTAASLDVYLSGGGVLASGSTDVTTLGFAAGKQTLTAASDAALRYGGINTSQNICGSDGATSCGDVAFDLTGAARTCPDATPSPIPSACYSRGAYEY